MNRPRVVVVEDDETLGEFFSMVLELLPVDHRLCRSAEEALEALSDSPADVLVTDLLLPGLDGRGLLKALRADGRRRGAARLVVMSGSIDDASRRELTQLGVWRVLGKPVTVKAFKECIEQALHDGDAPPTGSTGGTAPLSAAERAIIESHFAGHEALFLAYRQGSLHQFPRDIEQGDRALQTSDWAGLRRVAHNLKSVLRTLAHEELAQTAAWLEDEAAARQGGAVSPTISPAVRFAESVSGPHTLEQGWQMLRDGLNRLLTSASA